MTAARHPITDQQSLRLLTAGDLRSSPHEGGTLLCAPRGGAPAIPRGGQPFVECTSLTGLFVATRYLRPSEVVLVVRDRVDLAGDGARIVQQLGRLAPAATRTALVEDPSADLAAALRAAGATLRDARTGEAEAARAPDDAALEDWRTWLRAAYGVRCEPTVVRLLALLAGAGDRSTFADLLVEEGRFANRAQAVRAIRSLTKALADEEHRNAGAVAAEATSILRGLAEVRQLDWRPVPDLSLTRAAEALRRSPSLAIAAGLTPADAGVLLDLHQVLAEERSQAERAVGAPPRSAVREARRWAVGRLAHQRGATAASVDALALELLDVALAAGRALGVAAAESLRAPQARLAAAIDLLAVIPRSARPDWLGTVDGAPAWIDHSVWQLAASAQDVVPRALCRRLIEDADRRLARADALANWRAAANDSAGERGPRDR